MIGFRRLQQQQGVTRRRGVEHHKAIFAPGHCPGERAEHGDFLRAGRTQIFGQKGPAIGIKILPGGRHHLFDVGAAFRLRINPADLQARDLPRRRRNVGGGVGGAHMHLKTAPGQFRGDGGGKGGFAHATLAHGHHQAASGLGNAIHHFTL